MIPDTDTRPFSFRVAEALDHLLTPTLRERNEEPMGFTEWGMGHDSAMQGHPLDACPFDVCDETTQAAEWQAGWHAATYGGG